MYIHIYIYICIHVCVCIYIYIYGPAAPPPGKGHALRGTNASFFLSSPRPILTSHCFLVLQEHRRVSMERKSLKLILSRLICGDRVGCPLVRFVAKLSEAAVVATSTNRVLPGLAEPSISSQHLPLHIPAEPHTKPHAMELPVYRQMAALGGDCTVQVVSAFSYENLCPLKLSRSGKILDVKHHVQATLQALSASIPPPLRTPPHLALPLAVRGAYICVFIFLSLFLSLSLSLYMYFIYIYI